MKKILKLLFGIEINSTFHIENISETVRLVHIQNGPGDLFGKIWLERKINKKWERRAYIYSCQWNTCKLDYLLSEESTSFNPFGKTPYT